MIVSYKDMNGKIVHVGKDYMTFTPFNSNALLVICKFNWHLVTPVELAQTP